ncbi:MAG: hypothetical protein CMJ83_04270 [Planctomycetes bacterium]|nr:hypothetical protein [Planctomycetota bacterium]
MLAELVTLWFLSATEGHRIGEHLPGPSGNLMHAPAGGLLAALLVRTAVPLRGWISAESWPGLRTRVGGWTLAACFAWGVIDEVHQFHVLGRNCSVLDICADVLGALLVLVSPWPAGLGRATTWRPVIVLALIALGLGVLGWLGRPFPDRVLEDLVTALTGSSSR